MVFTINTNLTVRQISNKYKQENDNHKFNTPSLINTQNLYLYIFTCIHTVRQITEYHLFETYRTPHIFNTDRKKGQLKPICDVKEDKDNQTLDL